MQRTIALGQYAPNRCRYPEPAQARLAQSRSSPLGLPNPQETLSRIEAKNRPERLSKKVEDLSISDKSLVRFAVESAGHFDLEAELKLWTSGMSTPIQKSFSTAVNIYEVQGLLAEYVGR